MKILITGASTGIGAESARELAAGNELFRHYDASSDAVEGVATDVEQGGGVAYSSQADLRSQSGCTSLYEQVAADVSRRDRGSRSTNTSATTRMATTTRK